MPSKTLPFLSQDPKGVPFPAPWAARAFAMTLQLSRAGYFTWPEWVSVFSSELADNVHGAHAGAGDIHDYYECWVTALEKMLAQKRLLNAGSLKASQAQTLISWPEPNHIAHREPVGRSLPLALSHSSFHVASKSDN